MLEEQQATYESTALKVSKTGGGDGETFSRESVLFPSLGLGLWLRLQFRVLEIFRVEQ